MKKFFASLALASTVTAAALAAPPAFDVTGPSSAPSSGTLLVAQVAADSNAVIDAPSSPVATATATATVIRPRQPVAAGRATSGHITLRRASDHDLPFPWGSRTAASMSRLAEFRDRTCDVNCDEPADSTAGCAISRSRASASAFSSAGGSAQARASAVSGSTSSVRVPSLPSRFEPVRPTGVACASSRPACSTENLTPIDQVLASLPEPIAPENVAPAKTPAVAPPMPASPMPAPAATPARVENPAPAANETARSSQRHVTIACVSTSKGKWVVTASWMGANGEPHRCDLKGTRREIATQLEILPPRVAAQIRQELNLPAPTPEPKPESAPVVPEFSAPVPVLPPVVVPQPESTPTDKEGC